MANAGFGGASDIARDVLGFSSPGNKVPDGLESVAEKFHRSVEAREPVWPLNDVHRAHAWTKKACTPQEHAAEQPLRRRDLQRDGKGACAKVRGEGHVLQGAVG